MQIEIMERKIIYKRKVWLILLTAISLILLPASLHAQAPEKISYQTIIRNSSGEVLVNRSVKVRITLLKSSPSGTIVYREVHDVQSNDYGLVSFEIGGGTVIAGTFSSIDWSDGPYYVKTEIDPDGQSNYTISGTSQLLSVPYALHAKSAESIVGADYSIGDFAQGGVIIWLDNTGQHGLVCAITDQIERAFWFSTIAVFHYPLSYGDGIYAGEMNTALIVAVQGIGNGDMYAARACAEYKSNQGGVEYGDWYLPSKEELNIMYEKKSVINAVSLANGGTAFRDYFYWSSTEYDQFHAYYQYFPSGQATWDGKNNDYSVRSVRAF